MPAGYLPEYRMCGGIIDDINEKELKAIRKGKRKMQKRKNKIKMK